MVYALQALEPDTLGLGGLLESFATMQHRQLALPRSAGRTHKPSRGRASRAIPRRLVEGYASLVVAYAESTLDPAVPGGRKLLCCAAERPATAERFHRVLRHPNLSDSHLEHLGLRREAVEQGVSAEQFRDEWSRFLGDTDNLAAWNHSTLELLCNAAGAPPGGVALKATYHNLRRFRGSLEDVVRQEGLGEASHGPTLAESDRASARLSNARALALFLHERASGALDRFDPARGTSAAQ